MFSITHKGTASSTSQYEINSVNHCPSALHTAFRHIKVTANERHGRGKTWTSAQARAEDTAKGLYIKGPQRSIECTTV